MLRFSRRLRQTLTISAAVAASGFFAAPAFAGPTTQTITTVAGNGTAGSGGDGGPAVKAQLDDPTGVATSLTGTLYISDSGNNKVRQVVNVTTINSDTITTVAGTGARGFSGDGGPAKSAKLAGPTGVAVDAGGDIFIADTLNNRVREVTPNGIIKTVAGDGKCRPFFLEGNGGKATSASLCAPTGVSVDSAGDLYISDTAHNEVRMVNTSGVISDFAGNGLCLPVNNSAVAATSTSLCGPTGVAAATTGTVFVADTGHAEVRDVKSGVIHDFAGKGVPGYCGDGGPATSACLNGPTGIGPDSLGNVYISDTNNNRLRVVNASGVISTSAGTGVPGFSGDGGPATAAELHSPTGAVAVDGSAVYFADTGNNRVRGVFNGPPPVLPDTALAILLPITGVLLLGGVVLWRRRRNRAVLTGGIA